MNAPFDAYGLKKSIHFFLKKGSFLFLTKTKYVLLSNKTITTHVYEIKQVWADILFSKK